MHGTRRTAMMLALFAFGSAASRAADAPFDGRAAFAQLKALAGTWQGTVEGEASTPWNTASRRAGTR